MLGLGLSLGKSSFVGGGFDADYQKVLDYASHPSRNYTLPSDAHQILQNAIVVTLKQNDIWGRLDLFYITAVGRTEQGLSCEDFSRINWKNPDFNYLTDATSSGTSPAFTQYKGFNNTGPDTIETGFDLNGSGKYTLDNAGAFVAFTEMGTQSESNNRPYGNSGGTNFLSPRIDKNGASAANRNWINGSDYQNPNPELEFFHKDNNTIFFQNRTSPSIANYRSTDLANDTSTGLVEDNSSNSSSFPLDSNNNPEKLVLLRAKGDYLETTAKIGMFGIGSKLSNAKMQAVETAWYTNYYTQL